ncbi:glucose-6-phosphate exchanger SLC37A4-like isoform X2 [Strongylocentrotus purpuratus]|uniref:Major facilitator superfamily (MFS) profile domain-containing protein n=1 Tax=Strongylocentrotus purpuratus TaxID=7668 RepID=A0A7M7PC17_STRPU|nr:glucose-6-phosphate exchanger SLC37A4-like isoform X2 [Strongylocentrotus purpuratus]
MLTLYNQWRLINVGTLFIGYGLYILNRKSFVFLLPEIIEDEHLKNNDLGTITSSLTLAYSISKFIGGILSDQISPRVMFPLGLFATGALSLQFSVSTSVQSFILVSFLMGLAQGVGWPAVAKVLKQWYPQSEIGLWWSLISAAANVAGTLGPLGLALLAINFGWRGAMQFCAGGAIIVAATAGFMIRSSPTDVGLPSIQTSSDQPNKSTDDGRGDSSSVLQNLWAILSSPALWVISLLFLISNFLVNGITDWGQLFLIQEKGLSHTTGSSFTSAYSLGATVGSITSGYITDKLVAKYGRRRRGTSRYPWLLLMVALNLLSLHTLRNYIDREAYQELILLVGLCLGIAQKSCVVLFGILAVENSPIHLSGTVHAFAALASSVGGVLAGLPLTYISQHYTWSHALYCMESASFLSLVVMLLIRRMNMRIGYQSHQKTD